MQFKESPFLEPEKPTRYRKEREYIENYIRNTLEGKNDGELRVLAEGFFGLMDTKKMVLSNSLSKEELDNLRVFVTHITKRILNSFSHKDNGLEGKLDKPGELQNILFHDISHAAGTIISGRQKINRNSPLPPFFEFKKHYEFNNKEVIENELYGFLWGTLPIGGTLKNFTKALLKDSKSESDFIKRYIDKCMRVSSYTNERAIKKYADEKDLGDDMGFLAENGTLQEKIIEDIKANPPQEMIRLLIYVWEHRENPRVLADLFFQEIGPYIEELKKRKVYKENVSTN